MNKTKDVKLLEDNEQGEYLKTINQEYKKTRTRLVIKNVLFLFLLSFLGIIFFLSSIVASSESKFATTVKKNFLINQISHLISADTKKLAGEKDERTNLLILGMGGLGHDGAFLTDTIIILSYDYENQETSLVSLPRDFLVKVDNTSYQKVNYIYTAGEYSENSNGIEYSKKVLSQNLGIPIHYAISIDFFGFEEIIDALGGVNVYVENSFIDYQYPTKDHKIQTVEFEKGNQHLNGEEALQFVRSRHGIVTEGNGFEASDFARSDRQFKIIESIKSKIMSFSTISNPNKVINLFKILDKYIDTDIEAWEALRFVDILRTMEKDKIFNKVLNDAPGNLLRSATSTLDGAFILVPKNNDYRVLQSFFNNIFKTEKTEKEQAVIQILNGTTQAGLAGNKSQLLINAGLNVIRIGNAPTQDIETTIIYDLSDNKKPETLKKIQESILGVRSNILTENLEEYLYQDNLDFLIVLGADQLAQTND
jgi:polyisoprenyl-teichoic acid--peptidoglycan teichoic acid transferase